MSRHRPLRICCCLAAIVPVMLFVSPAHADQCMYFNAGTADLVSKRIKTGDILLNYCEPCEMPEPLPVRVTTLQVEKEPPQESPRSMNIKGHWYTYEEIYHGRVPGLREEERRLLLSAMEVENPYNHKLIINNEAHDLAYLYYPAGAHSYQNLGVEAGCAGSVSPVITYRFPDKSKAAAEPDSPHFEDITTHCYDGSCLLKEWLLVKRASLLGEHTTGAPVIAEIEPGEKVTVNKILSEIHPARAQVVFDQGRFLKGDEFYILNSLGEGFFRVWYYGRVVEEELMGVSMERMENGEWTGCPEPDANCWAEAEGYPEEVWWGQVTMRDGRQGWLRSEGLVESVFEIE